MNRDKIKEAVIEIVVETIVCSADDITEASILDDDLGADSLDLVEIAVAIEERFDIDLDDEDLEGVSTIEHLIDLVEGNLESSH